MVLATIILAVLIVSFISFVGVFTLFVKAAGLQRFLNPLVSFAAGALIAAAFLDLLPEALALAEVESVMFVAMLGILAFFIIERFLYWFHCHNGKCEGHMGHMGVKLKRRSVGVLNLFGDGLHNFLDGAAIAAAFLASPSAGWIATVAVALHEIPQEFGDFAVLLYAGYSRTQALFYNFLSALTAVAGALVAFFFAQSVTNAQPMLLAFGAGGFIYIALADLLPGLHHESELRRATMQLIWFLLGIGVIWLVIGLAHGS